MSMAEAIAIARQVEAREVRSNPRERARRVREAIDLLVAAVEAQPQPEPASD